MPDQGVQLQVAGVGYGGWKTMRITRGLEQLAGTFELSVTERWSGQSTMRPILRGSKCQVQLDGTTVITGFVDTVEPSYDSDSHSIKVTGRDVTGDLVDCSMNIVPFSYSSLTIDKIAAALCQPFGIGVIVDEDVDVGAPFPVFNLEQGQSYFEILLKIARHRGVLLTSDGQGNLLLTQPDDDEAPTAITLGQNVKSGRGRASLEDCYSKYTIYGSTNGQGIPTYDTSRMDIEASCSDDVTVKRYRPKAIIGDTNVINITNAQTRVNWERTVAVARSVKATHTVNGWSHSEGLWEPNTTVPVNDPFMNLNETRLISEVAYLLDEKGRRTDITTVGLGGYDVFTEPDLQANFGAIGS